MMSTNELRVRAARLRTKAMRLDDSQAAERYRAMADAYDQMADHRSNSILPWESGEPKIG